jgi:hypothetical protein
VRILPRHYGERSLYIAHGTNHAIPSVLHDALNVHCDQRFVLDYEYRCLALLYQIGFPLRLSMSKLTRTSIAKVWRTAAIVDSRDESIDVDDFNFEFLCQLLGGFQGFQIVSKFVFSGVYRFAVQAVSERISQQRHARLLDLNERERGHLKCVARVSQPPTLRA